MTIIYIKHFLPYCNYYIAFCSLRLCSLFRTNFPFLWQQYNNARLKKCITLAVDLDVLCFAVNRKWNEMNDIFLKIIFHSRVLFSACNNFFVFFQRLIFCVHIFFVRFHFVLLTVGITAVSLLFLSLLCLLLGLLLDRALMWILLSFH